jgi:hypothetical protein
MGWQTTLRSRPFMVAASFFAALLSCACAAGEAVPDKAAPKTNPGAGAAAQPGPAKKDAPVVPQDVEKDLKAAGWTTITGTWTKKGKNIYEVTDGKLETPKTNGVMQVIVFAGGTGSVKVMVRNSQKKEKFSHRVTDPNTGNLLRTITKDLTTGFGFEVEPAAAKPCTPYAIPNSKPQSYRAAMEKEVPLSGARNKFFVSLNENKLELYLNDARKHNSNYKLTDEGPFTIEISGTATIESPQVMGK